MGTRSSAEKVPHGAEGRSLPPSRPSVCGYGAMAYVIGSNLTPLRRPSKCPSKGIHPLPLAPYDRGMVLSHRGALLWACAAILLLSGCSRTGPVEAAAPSTPPTVPVAKVVPEDLSHSLALTAEFKPYQEIDVMAKVAGYIKDIRVDVGDRVQEGQLLALLEVPEMADDLRHA